jgi:hypothetical protein
MGFSPEKSDISTSSKTEKNYWKMVENRQEKFTLLSGP